LLSETNFIFATDAMHRAATARAVGGYDRGLHAYEDWMLWLKLTKQGSCHHIPAVVSYHHWHEGTVMAEKPWEEWEKVHETAHQIIGPRTVASFDANTWNRSRKELIWHSILQPNHSFGYVTRQMLLALERHGADIRLAPSLARPSKDLERFSQPIDNWGRLGFYYDFRVQPTALRCERVITYAMWESTFVPESHITEVNKGAVLLYVPCRQNADAYAECGITVPIRILHHGVDSHEFPLLDRKRGNVFTFGSFGDFSPRKGIDVLVRAFRDEFTSAESVRLLLKSNSENCGCDPLDPRISFLSGFWNQEKLLDFLGTLNVFVLPSRGEGFGLCGIEAMSTGLPLIATNWGGPTEYMNPADSYPLAYRLIDAGGVSSNYVRYFGQWAEPDYEHLRYLMRYLYEHPEEAGKKGLAAAARVHEKWTWDRVAQQMCRDLDQLVANLPKGRRA